MYVMPSMEDDRIIIVADSDMRKILDKKIFDDSSELGGKDFSTLSISGAIYYYDENDRDRENDLTDIMEYLDYLIED